MLPHLVWPQVITLSSFYFIAVVFNRIINFYIKLLKIMVIVIIRLMLTHFDCPEVITLSNFDLIIVLTVLSIPQTRS